MSKGRVVVNLRGTKFELSSKTFAKLVDLSHGSCLSEACVVGQNPKEYFFERNAASFEALLEFLHHGDLHLPPGVCPNTFRREMTFWGADVTRMGNCCYVKMVVFEENLRNLERFEQCANKAHLMYKPPLNSLWPRWERCRVAVWNILDVPSSSRAAKVYLAILSVFIIMSLFIMVANTHPFFRRSMSRDEWKQYLGDKATLDLLDALEDLFNDNDIDELFNDTSTDYEMTEELSNLTLKKNPYPEASARVDELRYMEYATIIFFTVDFIIRNAFSPRKIQHFFSFGNVIDFLALASVYVVTLIELLKPKEQFRISSIDFLECFQFLRVLRIVRLLRDVTGVRVLFYSIRYSAPELCLLFSFLAAGVFLFATIIFFIDDRNVMKSIPDSAWWAIITMTTVGYGDMVPVTFQGKCVGSLCAICGVIVIGLTVPIFVNNFVMFYSYSKTFESRGKTKKITRQGNTSPDSQHDNNKVFPEKDLKLKGTPTSPVLQAYTDVSKTL